jgi:redox-regulated HSP33 family molecular chaperone
LLTKEQLQDAEKCTDVKLCSDCKLLNICNCVSETAQTALSLIAERDSMRAMLKRLEWIAAQCPICYNYDYEGHKPDCAFAKLIKGE